MSHLAEPQERLMRSQLFGSVLLAFSSCLTPFALEAQSGDDLQHVIVATQNGDISEVFFSPTIGIHVTHPALANLPSIRAIAAYHTSNDGIQHIIVATQNGEIHEVFFNSSIGVHVTQPALVRFAGIVAIAAYFTPNDGISGKPLQM